MPKSHETHKSDKKKPLMTLKEKRRAKHEKKHEHDAQPLITPAGHH
jgi:hypothetical protein